MNYFIAAVVLAASMSLSVLAADTGGVSGRVVDVSTGKPLAHAVVAIYQLPVVKNAPVVESATTDRRGFFANLALAPGAYLVTANVMGKISSCVVDWVTSGRMTRMNIAVGLDEDQCSTPRAHPTVVNPAETTDLYIVH